MQAMACLNGQRGGSGKMIYFYYDRKHKRIILIPEVMCDGDIIQEVK